MDCVARHTDELRDVERSDQSRVYDEIIVEYLSPVVEYSESGATPGG